MRLSPETIYRSLYVQSRGTFKRELVHHLRTGRAKRQARGSSRSGQGRGQIKDKVMISRRPPGRGRGSRRPPATGRATC